MLTSTSENANLLCLTELVNGDLFQVVLLKNHIRQYNHNTAGVLYVTFYFSYLYVILRDETYIPVRVLS